MKKTFIFSIDYSALEALKKSDHDKSKPNHLVKIFEGGNKSIALYPKNSAKSISDHIVSLTKNAITDTPATKAMPLPFSKGKIQMVGSNFEEVWSGALLENQKNVIFKDLDVNGVNLGGSDCNVEYFDLSGITGEENFVKISDELQR